jgi:hypothetical protein
MGEGKSGRPFERQVADLYRALGAWKVEHDVLMAGHWTLLQALVSRASHAAGDRL